MNPLNFLQFKPAWEQFRANHPKLVPFIRAISRDGVMDEGTVVEIKVTTSQGRELSSNIRVRQSDLEFFHALKDMVENQK